MKIKLLDIKRAGFTLVELLIVITIIGILTTAVLAAINPVEQIRKSNDVAKKADASTLLAANDRFLATFGCYPWYYDGTECLLAPTVDLTTIPIAIDETSFTTPITGANYYIEENDEIKEQFKTRSSITQGMLSMFEDADGQLSVCFTPESKSSRAGGLGPIVTWTNVADGTEDCTGAYLQNDPTCAVCVPQ